MRNWRAGPGALAFAAMLAGCATDVNAPLPESPVSASIIRTPNLGASTPISIGGVTPYLYAGNENDLVPAGPDRLNRACAEVTGIAGALAYKINSPPLGTGLPFGSIATYTSDGTYFSWTAAAGVTVEAVVMKGGPQYNVYYYQAPDGPALSTDAGLASPVNASGGPAGISHVTICYTDGGGTANSTLSVQKYYDANVNGTYDLGEATIEGWKFSLAINGAAATDQLTTFSQQFPSGTTYQASEYQSVIGTWFQTEPAGNLYAGTLTTPTTLWFGNVCVGGGGGKTLGFWSNKNGQALYAADDQAMLVALNLRNASGAHFDPASHAQFRSWILGATATNMAYMLSAQLAAMSLNVHNGNVVGSAMIHAPGTGVENAFGFASVSAVMTAANTSLGTNGSTVTAGAIRTLQEALKNALDNANNNLNFVQATPCAFGF